MARPPATEGYMGAGMKKKMFKDMTLSRQGNSIKATHRFIDPMHDSEHYLFGEGEGKGLMNHISKHLGFASLGGKKMAPEGPEEANAAAVHEQEGKD